MRRQIMGALCVFVVSGLGAACSDRNTDSRLAELEEFEQWTRGLSKGTAGAANGSSDYCNDALFLCDSGEGDCDNDAQCLPGLICATDAGDRFGFHWSTDVCLPSHCVDQIVDFGESGIDCGGECGQCISCAPASAVGSGDFCTAQCPCPSGSGDCDVDAQCAGGAVCGVDNGLRFGFAGSIDVCVPPHCVNQTKDADEDGVDCGGADCGLCVQCQTAQQVGSADFCSALCPCPAGSGDCDVAEDCEAGLICVNDVGDLFGFHHSIDVCLPSHCANGMRDQDELEVDCGGADCGACANCSARTLGTPDSCSERCPCASGGGDCDNDSQCTQGTVCGTDNGDRFGFDVTIDVCVPEHCLDGALDSDELAVDCGGGCGACPAECVEGCTSPPAPSCERNVIVEHRSPGRCDFTAGNCTYLTVQTTCPNGCLNGACTDALSWLGDRGAFQSSTGAPIQLANGVASGSDSVSIIVQSYPRGSVSTVSVYYTTNSFGTTEMLAMSFDKVVGNNDQWFAVIPAEAAGTNVVWYIRAEGYAGNVLWDSNNGQNYSYVTQ